MEVLMKTNDIIKLGIGRNFIRECERQGLINPIRNDGKMIVNEKYCPREYSDSDVKIIWQAYLFRKMGLSFSEIKRWRNGENINIRTSINDSIEKFEHQIAELEAIIRFMKYVRGEGLFPKMPEKMNKTNNFTEFINEYMQGIDPNKKRVEYLEHIHSEIELSKTPIDKMTGSQLLESEENKKYFDNFHKSFLKNNTDSKHNERIELIIGGVENLILLKNRNVDCGSDESIDEFRKLYNYCKKDFPDATPLAFVFFIIDQFFVQDTDINDYMTKAIGKENIKYIRNVALAFARAEDPQAYADFLEAYEGSRS